MYFLAEFLHPETGMLQHSIIGGLQSQRRWDTQQGTCITAPHLVPHPVYSDSREVSHHKLAVMSIFTLAFCCSIHFNAAAVHILLRQRIYFGCEATFRHSRGLRQHSASGDPFRYSERRVYKLVLYQSLKGRGGGVSTIKVIIWMNVHSWFMNCGHAQCYLIL